MATKIDVNVNWTEDNYCCSWLDGQGGVVLVTSKTLDGLKADFEESLMLHIEGCVADGDVMPDYLVKGDYDIVYHLDASALIRVAEGFTTMSVISKVSGINAKQLSHYANGNKTPRAQQMDRIRAALAVIGAQLVALS